MVQMVSILFSQKRKRQRGSGWKLSSTPCLVYIAIEKGRLLLSVTRKQMQGLLRPGYSLNLYVARRSYCDNLVWRALYSTAQCNMRDIHQMKFQAETS